MTSSKNTYERPYTKNMKFSFNNLKYSLTIAVAAAFASQMAAAASHNPKREFRGAWMHTIFQNQYHDQTTDENKAYLRDQLDKLKAAGVNAVIFQVRPQSDSFYQSDIEPWSRFLTDDGKAPEPFWDPLSFMVDEAHKRGMELHAWLNPYRVTSSPKQTLPAGHIYHKHPERFVRYDGKLYFDPALPENREYIADVVCDIVSRYDIDGIHFDDYFYPYPAKTDFPDDKSYARYGKGTDRGDWRRKNVDLLIEDLNGRIKAIKPWVRFGISPFGIWRNKKSDPRGSETDGLQNYDALYADVLLWAEKGWVDYLMPQLYWELEHPRASYLVLVDWWDKNASGRPVYVGQDVEKTMKLPDLAPSNNPTQLDHKIALTRKAKNIDGNCWWPAYSVTRNSRGVADSLATNQQSTPALVPVYPWLQSEGPESVVSLKANGRQLTWDAPTLRNAASDAVRFVIYRFDNDKAFDLEDSDNIVAVTGENSYVVTKPGYYIVTALDRVNNESTPSEPVKIK